MTFTRHPERLAASRLKAYDIRSRAPVELNGQIARRLISDSIEKAA